MKKLDLKREYKTYYSATTQPQLVELSAAHFLAIAGKGDPSSEGFLRHIQALYSTVYTLKFMYKGKGHDFVVPSLEALWWFDMKKYGELTMATAPEKVPRSEWEYRLLIRLPDFVKKEDTEVSRGQALRKKGLPEIEAVTYERMNEGLCVQLLHVGPFAEEAKSLKKMEAFMQANQLTHNGDHHEIYLSNFNRTPPHRLRTILREPVRKTKGLV